MPLTQRTLTLSLAARGVLSVAAVFCSNRVHADPDRVVPSNPPIRAPSDSPDSAQLSPAMDYTTARTEFAGAPMIGGNSDIGVQFGGVATVARFGDGIEPYRWNMNLVLTASVRSGPHGPEIAQQSYLYHLDIPDLVPDVLRMRMTVSYERIVNQGYYGLGNASSSEIPMDFNGPPQRYHEFDQRAVVLRTLNRIKLKRPYVLMVATNFRYVLPTAYFDSKLARDASQGTLRGLHPLFPLAVGVGLGYDSRDNETFPTRGMFHQIGIRAAYAFPASASVQYGSVGTVLAGYVPIGGPFVFAARGVIDAQFGHVPFYDLFTGGVFQTQYLPGGPEGVRGVPVGRYLGLLKFVANVELRALLYEFHFLGDTFHLGGNVLADTGRVWQDYHFNNPADGSGIGLKWGAGVGAYLQWGQAVLFRAEIAYSPDAAAVSPGFPFGVYIADSVMF